MDNYFTRVKSGGGKELISYLILIYTFSFNLCVKHYKQFFVEFSKPISKTVHDALVLTDSWLKKIPIIQFYYKLTQSSNHPKLREEDNIVTCYSYFGISLSYFLCLSNMDLRREGGILQAWTRTGLGKIHIRISILSMNYHKLFL